MRSSVGLSNFGLGAASGCLVLALALMVPVPVLAAGFSCAPAADSGGTVTLPELDEVVVTGQEPVTRTKDLQAWLKLLVGQFTYEGHVDLCGRGNAEDQRPVTGKADCIGSRASPTVHCTVNVRWPEAHGENGLPVLGGVSSLFPAMVSYSLEGRHIPGSGISEGAFRNAVRTGVPIGPVQMYRWGLMFTQLDNRGVVEWGSGELVGDTFTSREPCVGIERAGTCQKITRITARPDGSAIAMVVDIRIDSRRVFRQTFLLHREPGSQKGEPSGVSSPTWAKGEDEHGAPLDAGARGRKRAEADSWLRRLAGTFLIEGTYRNRGGKSPVRGTARCIGIGDGPGMSCEIAATWKAPKESVKDPALDQALYDAMQPLVIHFGIDPDTSQVRATLLDYRASKTHGALIGDKLVFDGKAVSDEMLVRYSWLSSVVAIRPDDNVEMKLVVHPTSTQYTVAGLRLLAQGAVQNPGIDFDMQLHRQPPGADRP